MTITTQSAPDAPQVTVLTIDRPERRNALDQAALTALRQAVATVVETDARALILVGAGQNFCAGADISTVEDGDFVEELRGLLADLRSIAIPVIAALRGPALGAGTQLAMATDLRVASRDATFGIPAAKLGLTVDHYTVHHLADAVGHSVARAMLTGAEVFDAERLAAVGFVHRLVEDPEHVLDAAIEWAIQLTRLAPLTIAAHKAMLIDVEADGQPSAFAAAARAKAWGSEDLAEGIAAFGERRHPRFRGR